MLICKIECSFVEVILRVWIRDSDQVLNHLIEVVFLQSQVEDRFAVFVSVFSRDLSDLNQGFHHFQIFLILILSGLPFKESMKIKNLFA